MFVLLLSEREKKIFFCFLCSMVCRMSQTFAKFLSSSSCVIFLRGRAKFHLCRIRTIVLSIFLKMPVWNRRILCLNPPPPHTHTQPDGCLEKWFFFFLKRLLNIVVSLGTWVSVVAKSSIKATHFVLDSQDPFLLKWIFHVIPPSTYTFMIPQHTLTALSLSTCCSHVFLVFDYHVDTVLTTRHTMLPSNQALVCFSSPPHTFYVSMLKFYSEARWSRLAQTVSVSLLFEGYLSNTTQVWIWMETDSVPQQRYDVGSCHSCEQNRSEFGRNGDNLYGLAVP